MPWIPPQIEFEGEWLKLKTSSLGGINTNKELGEDKKAVPLEDLYQTMDKGKSSPVTTAIRLVTSREIADNQNTTPILQMQDPHVPDKVPPTMTDLMLLAA
jgi:hypothetical protein